MRQIEDIRVEIEIVTNLRDSHKKIMDQSDKPDVWLPYVEAMETRKEELEKELEWTLKQKNRRLEGIRKFWGSFLE